MMIHCFMVDSFKDIAPRLGRQSSDSLICFIFFVNFVILSKGDSCYLAWQTWNSNRTIDPTTAFGMTKRKGLGCAIEIANLE